jgi:hypothetical protein
MVLVDTFCGCDTVKTSRDAPGGAAVPVFMLGREVLAGSFEHDFPCVRRAARCLGRPWRKSDPRESQSTPESVDQYLRAVDVRPST